MIKRIEGYTKRDPHLIMTNQGKDGFYVDDYYSDDYYAFRFMCEDFFFYVEGKLEEEEKLRQIGKELVEGFYYYSSYYDAKDYVSD